MKNIFLSEIKEELNKRKNQPSSVLTEEDIKHLPLPVRNYIRGCGYIGKEKTLNGRIFWKDVLFRMNRNAAWIDLDCFQFNSIQEPCRIVYMKSRLFGLFPFEGRDKYQGGKGNMLIRLMKLFTLADAKSDEMDISGLVTTLAELLLFPSMALQSYIKWEYIDDFSAKAVINFAGKEASGTFQFNKDYEMTHFTTNDRFQSQPGNKYKNIRWSGIAENYIEKNGIKFPSSFKAAWDQNSGDMIYFIGAIEDITYNIKEFKL